MFGLLKSDGYNKYRGTGMGGSASLRGNALLRLYDNLSLTYDEYVNIFESNENSGESEKKLEKILNWLLLESFYKKYEQIFVKLIKENKPFDYVQVFNQHMTEEVKKYGKIKNDKILLDDALGLYQAFTPVRKKLVLECKEAYARTDMVHTLKSVDEKLKTLLVEIGEIEVDEEKYEKDQFSEIGKWSRRNKKKTKNHEMDLL